MTVTIPSLKSKMKERRPAGLPFRMRKLGHVVIMVTDLDRSVDFYTRLLGFQVSDVYGPDMGQGRGMVFLRCNTDHHCLALVEGRDSPSTKTEMHHMAFEVATLDELFRARDFLLERGVAVDMQGRRRAGCQLEIEFRDPDDYTIEIYCLLDQVGEEGRVRPESEWNGVLDSLEKAAANPVPGQDTTYYHKK